MHSFQDYGCHGLKWRLHQCPEHGGPDISSASSGRIQSVQKQPVAEPSQGGWDLVCNSISLAKLDQRAGELGDPGLSRATGNTSSRVSPGRTRSTDRRPIHKELL